MIMRDSSAAICHRYEGRVGGACGEIEREGGKCRPSVRESCHRTTITQASGFQFIMETSFILVCEGELQTK